MHGSSFKCFILTVRPTMDSRHISFGGNDVWVIKSIMRSFLNEFREQCFLTNFINKIGLINFFVFSGVPYIPKMIQLREALLVNHFISPRMKFYTGISRMWKFLLYLHTDASIGLFF
jgi:hypothetical protein